MMKPTKIDYSFLVIALLAFSARDGPAATAGTAFTYQGRLAVGTNAGNGAYDMKFTLYDAVADGSQIAGPLTNTMVVTDGLFTTTLDFGSNALNGNARWLEMGVRTNGSGGFTTLNPRQNLAPAPYAITAGSLSGTLPAAQLVGTLSSGQLSGTYNSVVSFGNASNSFRGNGATLTGVNAAALGGLSASSFWRTDGNNGTTAGVNFLGTTDNQPLELKVNRQRGLRLEPTTDAPNVIGGSSNNVAAAGAVGAAIGGGDGNTSGTFATVGGGQDNASSGAYATLGGGLNNTNGPGFATTVAGGCRNACIGDTASVGGGYLNSSGSDDSTIGGGDLNTGDNEYATVGGGVGNTSSGWYAVVGGGSLNLSAGAGAAVCGGHYNTSEGGWSAVCGGWSNSVPGDYATVGGGYKNVAQGPGSVVAGGGYDGAALAGNLSTGGACSIGGGVGNIIGGTSGINLNEACTISGGSSNSIAYYNTTCAIGGGLRNQIQMGNLLDGIADFSTISGGIDNTVSGYADHSTIGGGGNNTLGGFSSYSSIGGGCGNSTAAGLPWPVKYATISGGYSNAITSSPLQKGIQGTTIAGGSKNSATGDGSFVAGGSGNSANADHCFVAGTQASAGHYGQVAYASGQFGLAGDAQTSVYVCRGTTGNATQTELFLDGASQRMAVPTNSTWGFYVLVAGRASGGNSAAYEIRGAVKNIAGTCSLVGSITKTVLAEDVSAWDATVAADDTNDALVVKVTGAASTNIRWVASVRTVEVAY